MISLQNVVVFTLTFLGYAGLHSLRQGWSYSQARLQHQLDISKNYFGWVDFGYLVSYSVGLMTIGNLSRIIPLKYFVSVGMILASICYASFSVYYSINGSFSYVMTIIMMCLNGFFQSTGWPGLIGIFRNWFSSGSSRGLILGIWAINANIGNIIAELACNLIQTDIKTSWTYNFYTTAIITIFIAILIIIFLKDAPTYPKQQLQQSQPIQSQNQQQPQPIQSQNQQQPQPIQSQNQQQSQPIQSQKQQQSQPIQSQNLQQSLISEQQSAQKFAQPQVQEQVVFNVWTAIFIPKVPEYVVSYACLKGCIYGLLFWLPTILDQKGLGSQKGYISAMVDIGSFIGGVIVGYLGDRFGHRGLYLSPLLLISSIIMLIVAFALSSLSWTYYVTLLLLGISVGGPYNIIGTVMTIDLGQQVGGKNVSTVSALIEGTAAAFCAISQIIISVLPNNGIFYLFGSQCFLGGLVLLPTFLSEYRKIRGKNNE